MKIENVNQPGPEWDEFAEAQPGAGLGHARAWATVTRTSYGLEPHYLCARDAAGAVCGILPLQVFRGRPGAAARLISLPFLDSAGLLVRDEAVADALLAAALELCAAESYHGLELRCNEGARAEALAASTLDRVNLVLRLERDVEAQWELLRAKVRNQCRKAEREGLVLAPRDSSTLLEDFYRTFEINMRDLGSPVHSIGFFRAMAAGFGERLRFIVTHLEGRPVGGLVAIRFGGRVHVPWASTLRSERNRCPNNQIYWEAIRWAIESGAQHFDFGRSPVDGGTYRFKKGWGAEEEILAWRRFERDGRIVTQQAGTESRLLKQISQLWTRLPVPVASAIGARVRRYFAN